LTALTPEDLADLADLAPLSRDECARRGLRHSSDDDHVELEVSSGVWTLVGAMLRVASGRAARQEEK
jgi:hypothetical protein